MDLDQKIATEGSKGCHCLNKDKTGTGTGTVDNE